MSRRVKAGSTNVSVVIRIIDSGDGTPETGVTSVTGGLALEYRREGAVSTSITESDLSALTVNFPTSSKIRFVIVFGSLLKHCDSIRFLKRSSP